MDPPTVIFLNSTTPGTEPVAQHANIPWFPILIATALVAWALTMIIRRVKARNAPLPTRAELDERESSTTRTKLALLGLLAGMAYSAYWWNGNGTRTMQTAFHTIETAYLWWSLILTPTERHLLEFLFVGALAAIWAVLWLVHRFFWRSFFPDLLRLDPNDHGGGKPELVGRLYKQQRWSEERIIPGDGEFSDSFESTTGIRLYYKHGRRVFPLFRFDHVDVPTVPEPFGLGSVQLHCGRLERDPKDRFTRVPNADTFGSQPLANDFREAEVREDALRKVGIVLPGSAMNPETARRKYQNERAITAWDHKTFRTRPERTRRPPSPDPPTGDARQE